MMFSYGRRQAVARAVASSLGAGEVVPSHFGEADAIADAHPACRDCRFFDDYENGYSGRCRRHAPIVGKDRSTWPDVGRGDWCGDHEPFDAAAIVAAFTPPPAPTAPEPEASP